MPLIQPSAVVDLVAGTYLHVGVFRVSLANLLYLLTILILLIAALLAPFPRPEDERADELGSREARDVHPRG